MMCISNVNQHLIPVATDLEDRNVYIIYRINTKTVWFVLNVLWVLLKALNVLYNNEMYYRYKLKALKFDITMLYVALLYGISMS